MINSKIVKASGTIWSYLKIKNVLQKSNVIFIMGGSSILPVDKAAQLYKKSWAKYIVFCSVGGTFTNHKWKDGEAKAYHKRLIKLGVPRKSILWEGLATNTLD